MNELILTRIAYQLDKTGLNAAQKGVTELATAEERLLRNQKELSKPQKLFLTDALKQAQNEAASLNNEIADVGNTGKGLGLAAGAGILGLAAGLVGVGTQAVTTIAKFERLESVLKNTLGSNSEAQKALSEITDFAASTPFQVDEITQAYISLTNRGLQPTKAELTKLGDLAASQGESIGQFTEAILDATTGENERLKEFGIQATKSGNQVTFAFKGIQKTVANTPAAINAAILSFGELAGVSGSMAAVSKTLEGQWSNLLDTIDSLFVSLGDRGLAGAAKSVLGAMSSLVGTVADYVKVPMADKVREEQSEVNRLVSAITSQNEGSETRNALMAELGQKYPEILRFLDIENQSTTGLIAKVEELNAAYAQKITIAAFSDQLAEVEKKLTKTISEGAELQKKYGAENAAEEIKFRQQRIGYYEEEINRQKNLALSTAKTAKERADIEAKAKIATAKIIDKVDEDQLQRAIDRAAATDKSRTRSKFKEEGGGIDLSQQTKDILKLSELEQQQNQLLGESADIRAQIAQREAELLKTTAGKVIQGEKEKQAAKKETAAVDSKANAKAAKDAEQAAKENAKRERELEKLRIEAIEDETKRKIELVKLGLKNELQDYEGTEAQKAEFRKLKENETKKDILQIQKDADDKVLKERQKVIDDTTKYEKEARKDLLQSEIDNIKSGGELTLAQKRILLGKERDLALLINKERLDTELLEAEKYAKEKAKLDGTPEILAVAAAQAPIEQKAAQREANIRAKFGLEIQEVDFDAAKAEIDALGEVLQGRVTEQEIIGKGMLSELEDRLARGVISYADYEAEKTKLAEAGEAERLELQKKYLAKQLEGINALLGSESLTEEQRTDLLKKQQDLRLQLAGVALSTAELLNKKDEQGIKTNEERLGIVKESVNSTIELLDTVADATIDKDREVIDAQIENSKNKISELLSLQSEANLEQIEQEKIRLNQLIAAKEEAAKKEQRIANIIAAAQYTIAVAEGVLAIAKQAKLPFPYNIIAIAGTVAGLAAGGISLVSKFQATQSAANAGFEKGGYTGDGGRKDIAGVVHKGEFVMTAEKTKKHRPLLEALHSGRMDGANFVHNFDTAKVVKEQAMQRINDRDIIKGIERTNALLENSQKADAIRMKRELLKQKRHTYK